MDEFSLKNQSAWDNYGGLIILKATGSPHSIIWENRFVPFSHQVKVGTLFLLFIMFYLFLITKLMDFSRFYFESLNSNYAMLSSCPSLDAMFAGNSTDYQKWAAIDSQYIKAGEMVGYYQCYCNSRVGLGNIWQVWTQDDLLICKAFVKDGMGGSLATIPSGIMNAILTNVGAIIILKLIPLVRFHSRHKENHITVITIFVMSYLSMGILVMKRYWSGSSHFYLPPDFTPAWLLFYGKVFRTQMLLSNLMQYVGPCLKIIFKRGCCCCRRKNYRANTHNNSEFSMNRRYATILTTSFICFNYGFAIPMLFIVASLVFFI